VQANKEVSALVEEFRAKVIDEDSKQYTIIELTGNADKLNGFLEKLNPLGIIEITRTGPVGMRRGCKGFTIE
ncbi:MAG: hypothetical protein Q9M14_02155, partial [Mariprofundaceae bacterium]|nr:hypothetical protein [Mariprofundaceae bacterium]